MRRTIYLILMLSILTACAGGTGTSAPQATSPADGPALSTPGDPTALAASPEATVPSTVSSQSDDIFTQMGITLAAPACTSLTQLQTEGPYYKAGTPQRNSLLEEGMEGRRLILVGYVLDQNCTPLPNAWLDFWQADASGEYDNAGYRLRGHQFTDSQGRYYLETILPGLYESRPIEHIHVKVRPEGAEEVTSQLYFPDRPVEGLTVTLEDQGDYLVGYFNFVVQR